MFFFVSHRDHKIQQGGTICVQILNPRLLGGFNKADMSRYVKDLLSSWFFSNQYKTQEMCNGAVQRDPGVLRFVPNHFVTQEMCNEAVTKVSLDA